MVTLPCFTEFTVGQGGLSVANWGGGECPGEGSSDPQSHAIRVSLDLKVCHSLALAQDPGKQPSSLLPIPSSRPVRSQVRKLFTAATTVTKTTGTKRAMKRWDVGFKLGECGLLLPVCGGGSPLSISMRSVLPSLTSLSPRIK